MADLVNASAQAIADALAPSPQAPAARWRWGSVVSVNADGTMNVSIGGATVPSIRCAQHVMGAQVGDRVRVLYLGTEAMVDAVRASSALMSVPSPSMDADTQAAWLAALGISELFHFETVKSAEASIGEGVIREFTATAPTVAGMTCRGIVQTWYYGSGNPLVGASWRTSSTETIHARVRANSASTIRVWWLLLYTPDFLTTYGDWPE